MLINLEINHQTITPDSHETIVANSKEYLMAEMTFSDDWDGTSKIAVITDTKGQNAIKVALPAGSTTFTIPPQRIKAPGFMVSVIGSKDDTIITTSPVTYAVKASGPTTGLTPTEEEKSLIIQLQQDLDNKMPVIEGTATGPEILAYTSDKGAYIGSDTGHWYAWNGSKYEDRGAYRYTEPIDGSVTEKKLDTDLLEKIYSLGKFPLEITGKRNPVIDGNGKNQYNLGFYSSDYIEVPEGMTLEYADVAAYNRNGTTYNGLSFFDKDKKYISGITATDSAANTISGTADLPTGTKYVVFTIFEYGTTKRYGSCLIYKKSTNIDYTPTILCIGDSLTEGDYGSNPSGTPNIHAENYPHYLHEFTGFNAINAGVCGYDAKTYWNTRVVTKGLDVSAADIVVIMLGTNGGLTDTLDEDTTITSDQTFRDYADTETGDYCKIIEYCYEQTDNKVQIFLCTCPRTEMDRKIPSVTSANAVIPKIAKKYNLSVIDVYNELGDNAVTAKDYHPIDGLHFGKFGYSKLGSFIGSKIKATESLKLD